MSQTNLMQMADILLAPSPEPTMPVWLVLAGSIIVFMFLFMMWRYLTQPIIRLQRHLKRGKLSPREGAHRLARLAHYDNELQQQIDQLRFQRKPPDRSELMVLINKVKHGR